MGTISHLQYLEISTEALGNPWGTWGFTKFCLSKNSFLLLWNVLVSYSRTSEGSLQVFGIDYLQGAGISSSCNKHADCSVMYAMSTMPDSLEW